MPRQRSRSPLSPILATESATVRLFFILSVLLCSVNKAGLKTETWLLYCLRLRSRSPHNAKHSTSSYIYIFIYIRSTVRTSCPKSSTCFFFSHISIFLCRKCYTRFFFSGISIFRNLCIIIIICICIYVCHAPRNCIVGHGFFNLEFVGHGFVRHGFVNVGVAVLVGKCMQGPCSVVPDIRSMREYGNFPNS